MIAWAVLARVDTVTASQKHLFVCSSEMQKLDMHLYSLKNIFSHVSFCQVKFSRHMYCAFPKCCHVYLEENGITLKTGKMITPC